MEHAAVDVAAAGRQKRDDIRDLVRFAGSALRNLGEDRGLYLLGEFLGHLCVDEAGCNGVYEDLSARELLGERLREGVETGFHHRVRDLACIAGMTMSTVAESYAHLDTSDFQTTTELVDETMAALGEKCSLVAGEKNRENRKFMEKLSREQQVEIVGRHAIDSFFDGKVPEQNI